MDNNFSKILDIFKRLDENHPQGENSDWYDRDGNPDEFGAYDAAGHYHDEREDTDAGYDAYKEREWTDEGSMASAEQHSTGPEFTGYWKGTDKRTPGKHMVGADEGIEQECDNNMSPLESKLRARWEQTKKEQGVEENIVPVVPTGTAMTTPDPAKAAATTTNLKGELDTAKSKGLVPSGTNTQQTAQAIGALSAAGGDMNKVPGNLKKSLGTITTGIAAALGAGADPSGTGANKSKVQNALGALGQVAKTAE